MIIQKYVYNSDVFSKSTNNSNDLMEYPSFFHHMCPDMKEAMVYVCSRHVVLSHCQYRDELNIPPLLGWTSKVAVSR